MVNDSMCVKSHVCAPQIIIKSAGIIHTKISFYTEQNM